MEAQTETALWEQVGDGQKDGGWMASGGLVERNGVCAICLDEILIQEETALVNGCEHAYCVTCILRWATYHQKPFCPQCKHPFEFLHVHRSLDGRAAWFVPLTVEAQEDLFEETEDLSQYYDDDDNEHEDDLDEAFYFNSSSPNIRIGNRRWGDNGYVRAGRKEARPINRQFDDDPDAGPSRCPKKKEASSRDVTGRRAKRALKREVGPQIAANFSLKKA